ncbi:MAG: hypothetical protein NC924_02070 [Candidatus Omnitrophica bacterium]|nr:hypothetical protein [Candidatus Omnitrophota bacterium]
MRASKRQRWKLISAILVQAMLSADLVWAGGAVFGARSEANPGNLSPRLRLQGALQTAFYFGQRAGLARIFHLPGEISGLTPSAAPASQTSFLKITPLYASGDSPVDTAVLSLLVVALGAIGVSAIAISPGRAQSLPGMDFFMGDTRDSASQKLRADSYAFLPGSHTVAFPPALEQQFNDEIFRFFEQTSPVLAVRTQYQSEFGAIVDTREKQTIVNYLLPAPDDMTRRSPLYQELAAVLALGQNPAAADDKLLARLLDFMHNPQEHALLRRAGARALAQIMFSLLQEKSDGAGQLKQKVKLKTKEADAHVLAYVEAALGLSPAGAVVSSARAEGSYANVESFILPALKPSSDTAVQAWLGGAKPKFPKGIWTGSGKNKNDEAAKQRAIAALMAEFNQSAHDFERQWQLFYVMAGLIRPAVEYPLYDSIRRDMEAFFIAQRTAHPDARIRALSYMAGMLLGEGADVLSRVDPRDAETAFLMAQAVDYWSATAAGQNRSDLTQKRWDAQKMIVFQLKIWAHAIKSGNDVLAVQLRQSLSRLFQESVGQSLPLIDSVYKTDFQLWDKDINIVHVRRNPGTLALAAHFKVLRQDMEALIAQRAAVAFVSNPPLRSDWEQRFSQSNEPPALELGAVRAFLVKTPAVIEGIQQQIRNSGYAADFEKKDLDDLERKLLLRAEAAETGAALAAVDAIGKQAQPRGMYVLFRHGLRHPDAAVRTLSAFYLSRFRAQRTPFDIASDGTPVRLEALDQAFRRAAAQAVSGSRIDADEFAELYYIAQAFDLSDPAYDGVVENIIREYRANVAVIIAGIAPVVGMENYQGIPRGIVRAIVEQLQKRASGLTPSDYVLALLLREHLIATEKDSSRNLVWVRQVKESGNVEILRVIWPKDYETPPVGAGTPVSGETGSGVPVAPQQGAPDEVQSPPPAETAAGDSGRWYIAGGIFGAILLFGAAVFSLVRGVMRRKKTAVQPSPVTADNSPQPQPVEHSEGELINILKALINEGVLMQEIMMRSEFNDMNPIAFMTLMQKATLSSDERVGSNVRPRSSMFDQQTLMTRDLSLRISTNMMTVQQIQTAI